MSESVFLDVKPAFEMHDIGGSYIWVLWDKKTRKIIGTSVKTFPTRDDCIQNLGPIITSIQFPSDIAAERKSLIVDHFGSFADKD